jgi:hypothetical protein
MNVRSFNFAEHLTIANHDPFLEEGSLFSFALAIDGRHPYRILCSTSRLRAVYPDFMWKSALVLTTIAVILSPVSAQVFNRNTCSNNILLFGAGMCHVS